MHSYYKKILERKRELRKSTNPTGHAYGDEKKPPVEIPEIHIPVAQLYRSREFNIETATAKERDAPMPVRKMVRKNKELLAQLGQTLLNDQKPNSGQKNQASPSKGFKMTLQKVATNKGVKNESQTIITKSNKLPEILIQEIERKKYNQSPKKDQYFTLREDKFNELPAHKDPAIINPYSFERTKRFFKSKYDRVSPDKVRDLSFMLERNREKRSAHSKTRYQRQTTEDSQERSRDYYQGYEPSYVREEVYVNKTTVLSPRDSVIIDDETMLAHVLKQKKKQTQVDTSKDMSDWIIPPNEDEEFDEKTLLTVIDTDMRNREAHMDYLRNGKKRTMTLGDKYYFLDGINDKYLKGAIDEQRKILDSISLK